MNAIDIFGVISGSVGIAGFLYSIYVEGRGRKEKLLLYGKTGAVPLAKASSSKDNYKLFVSFQREGGPEEKIPEANLRFVRIANLGKEPIRREDIAPANPVKLSVEGVRVLDISVVKTSRSVIRFSLEKITVGLSGGLAELTFDFLDHNDGALLCILTAGAGGKVSIKGDVIGMPEGIRRNDEVRSLRIVNSIGVLGAVLLLVGAFALAGSIVRKFAHGWDAILLFALPFIALYLPMFVVGIVASTIWPSKSLTFPQTLALPGWFTNNNWRGFSYSVRRPYFDVRRGEDEDDGQR